MSNCSLHCYKQASKVRRQRGCEGTAVPTWAGACQHQADAEDSNAGCHGAVAVSMLAGEQWVCKHEQRVVPHAEEGQTSGGVLRRCLQPMAGRNPPGPPPSLPPGATQGPIQGRRRPWQGPCRAGATRCRHTHLVWVLVKFQLLMTRRQLKPAASEVGVGGRLAGTHFWFRAPPPLPCHLRDPLPCTAVLVLPTTRKPAGHPVGPAATTKPRREADSKREGA